MAVDKLVDSTQLDADLTSVANAIRTKGGTSASLAFPADFVSAIAAISGGGGDPYEVVNKIISRTLTTFESSAVIIEAPWLLANQTNLTTIRLPECTDISSATSGNTHSSPNFAYNCSALTTIYAPKLAQIRNATSVFENCTSLVNVVLPSLEYTFQGTMFAGCTSLVAFDCGNSGITASKPIFGQNFFKNDTSLTTIILRHNAVMTLSNTNVFTGTKFASGGTGGTIYIPKALYDHLGDGTSSDYKAATNWSTIDGYGTITWAKIEGSIYENAYADGTTIPTS